MEHLTSIKHPDLDIYNSHTHQLHIVENIDFSRFEVLKHPLKKNSEKFTFFEIGETFTSIVMIFAILVLH